MESLLIGIALALAVGGIYILFLAIFRPNVFPKPGRAKLEGTVVLIIGVTILILYYKPWL